MLYVQFLLELLLVRFISMCVKFGKENRGFPDPSTITFFCELILNDLGMTFVDADFCAEPTGSRSCSYTTVQAKTCCESRYSTYTVDDQVDPGREEDGDQDSEQEHEQADRDHDPCNTQADTLFTPADNSDAYSSLHTIQCHLPQLLFLFTAGSAHCYP